MSTIIEFENIGKLFPGVKALVDVNFSIERGEIHALVGENGAGKSTLMNILGGLYSQTTGKVKFSGKEVLIHNELTALNMGIGVVYQELKLCPNLTVAENIFLGREIREGKGKINWRKMNDVSRTALIDLSTAIQPETLVKNLSIAEQQIVEIAKSITKDIKVLILDEPTSALTLKETESLFKNIKGLQQNGVTIIYISHRLEEIITLCDRISILRDGKYQGTFSKESITLDKLVKIIAGKELLNELCRSNNKNKLDKPLLVIKDLSSPGVLKNINMTLYKKEIIGVYGVQGAGRTELLEAIFGLDSKKTGYMELEGKRINNRNPAEAIKNGFAMVPEDRRQEGIFPNFNVFENISTSNGKDISNLIGFLKNRKIRKIANKYKTDIGIKTKDIFQSIQTLSGGNQQKVIISRWLATNPKIFLVDELTRGVDVGAKAEIFKILRKLRTSGLSIILVSSELAEIVSESDRVLVMRNGSLVAELTGQEINKDKIIYHALCGEEA